LVIVQCAIFIQLLRPQPFGGGGGLEDYHPVRVARLSQTLTLLAADTPLLSAVLVRTPTEVALDEAVELRVD
jgi:hypothetical protein